MVMDANASLIGILDGQENFLESKNYSKQRQNPKRISLWISEPI